MIPLMKLRRASEVVKEAAAIRADGSAPKKTSKAARHLREQFEGPIMYGGTAAVVGLDTMLANADATSLFSDPTLGGIMLASGLLKVVAALPMPETAKGKLTQRVVQMAGTEGWLLGSLLYMHTPETRAIFAASAVARLGWTAHNAVQDWRHRDEENFGLVQADAASEAEE